MVVKVVETPCLIEARNKINENKKKKKDLRLCLDGLEKMYKRIDDRICLNGRKDRLEAEILRLKQELELE